MTRFNISLPDAANFVIDCLKNMKGEEIFVQKFLHIKFRCS